MTSIELDKGLERPVYSPVCGYCRHLGRRDPLAERQSCSAFPKGIPDGIWYGRHKHERAYPGDHGIHFAAKPDVAPQVLGKAGLAGGD